MHNYTKYEHIAKFRNPKGERIKLVIKSEKSVVVVKSPLGAVYEKSILRSDVLTRKFDNELDRYQQAFTDVVRGLLESLKFEFDMAHIENEICNCGVS